VAEPQGAVGELDREPEPLAAAVDELDRDRQYVGSRLGGQQAVTTVARGAVRFFGRSPASATTTAAARTVRAARSSGDSVAARARSSAMRSREVIV